MRGQEVLRQWQNKYNGTYRALCEAALKMKENTMAKWICQLGKGDWNSICPTDESSDGDRFPVQSTGVETTPSQPTIDDRGLEKQVVSGLRQRRIDTPALLTDAISMLYDALAVSCGDQSTISRLENKCSDLRRKLQPKTTEDLEQTLEQLATNEKERREFRELFSQKSMLEQSMNSQMEERESRVEDLKATSEQTNEELREKISKCEQEKLSLMDKFKENFMNQINKVTKKVDILVRDKKEMCNKMNRAIYTCTFAVDVCRMVFWCLHSSAVNCYLLFAFCYSYVTLLLSQ